MLREFSTDLLPALFPAYYKEQNWTLGKHSVEFAADVVADSSGDLGLSIMVDGNAVGTSGCSFWLCLG